MPESPIVKGLVFLADKLLSRLGVLEKAKREQRDRLAEYCEKIAENLSSAYRSLESGVMPHGLCSQMDHYMHDLRDVLEKSLSRQEFDELRDVLAVAYRVEHIEEELPPLVRKGSKFAELDIAAGKFQAISHKLKATK